MSAPAALGCLWLAGRAVRAIKDNSALRDSDLLTILDCKPEELRAAIAVAYRWRQIDRCGNWLVPAPRWREGRRAA